jgi:CRISPR-associated exonuclease Cas4
MLNNILMAIGVGTLLLAAALGLLLLNERRGLRTRLIAEKQRELGLPQGELVYQDADGQGEPLTSRAYPLVGKPDYVVKLPDGRPVPVELKLNVTDVSAPFSNHVVQVAAYCLILEEYFEHPPTYGIVRYADCEFTIDYTPALRKKVIRLLGIMQKCSQQQPPPLANQKAAKCRACDFKPICTIGKNK